MRRTLRSGDYYNLKTRLKKFSHEEHQAEASEVHTAKRSDGSNTEFSPNLTEERIKANLEPLHAQIFALTQMMNKLIQDNSARAKPTAGLRSRRFPSESPLTDGPRTSRSLPL